MRDADREIFARKIKALLDVYGRAVTDGALDVWWEILEPYPWEQVRIALQQHARGGMRAPTPADILALLPRAIQPAAPDAGEVIARSAPDREAARAALAHLRAIMARGRTT
jgi:hypothetical protein